MPQAGLVMVWSGDRPSWQLFDIPATSGWDNALVLGRALTPHDDRVSAKHFGLLRRIPGAFPDDDILLQDFKSRNHTYVNGAKVHGQKTMRDRSVIRSGRTVWVALFDVAPARDQTWAGHGDPIRMDELPLILVDVVRTISPDMAIHATVIERCLMAAWPDREHFVATIDATTRRLVANGKTELRGEDLTGIVPRDPALPFSQVFEKWMGGPPPFPIPVGYEVLEARDIALYPYEVMIGSRCAEDPPMRTLLMQAQVGSVRTMPIGWFMAGFWGHGVNSYAVYYGRCTETYRVYLRLPYGEGVYESSPLETRKRAYARIARTQRLVETLDVEHVELVSAMGEGYYRIACRDGRVLTSPPEERYYDWNDVDFEALVRG